MNYNQAILLSAKLFLASALQQTGFFFQSVTNFLNPQSFNHQQSKDTIISPLLVTTDRHLTLMHNRLK